MIDNSWFCKPPGIPTHLCAGGIVLARHESAWQLALIYEGAGDQVSLPKGHVEPRETLQNAAEREILEETGLRNLHCLGEIGVRERLNFKKNSWKITHYFLFITGNDGIRPGHDTAQFRMIWKPVSADIDFFWPEQARLIGENRDLIIASADKFLQHNMALNLDNDSTWSNR